jgi:hypothetical protein
MLTTLIDNNAALLEEYVDDSVVETFMRLIMDSGPNAGLMRFFKAICSCKGKQIITNQEGVLERLYHPARYPSNKHHKPNEPTWRRRLLLETRAIEGPATRKLYTWWHSLSDNSGYHGAQERAGATPATAGENKAPERQPRRFDEFDAAYQQQLLQEHGEFMGKREWTEGFPPVFVSWWGSDDWSMQTEGANRQLFYSARALGIAADCCRVVEPSVGGCSGGGVAQEEIRRMRGERGNIVVQVAAGGEGGEQMRQR